MLCSALNTEAELYHKSSASFRFIFMLESKPDHTGHTLSNQLLMSLRAVSGAPSGDGARGICSTSSWLEAGLCARSDVGREGEIALGSGWLQLVCAFSYVGQLSNVVALEENRSISSRNRLPLPSPKEKSFRQAAVSILAVPISWTSGRSVSFCSSSTVSGDPGDAAVAPGRPGWCL